MTPGRERVVDVDQLFSQFVEVEPFLRVEVNLEPGLRDRFDRPVAKVEAGSL